jgi:p-cumate 2,3-dioxygenase alpha subunit
LVDELTFEREKKVIFDTCWLYVGHESELTTPGQFHVRFAGGRELIFNRDMSGEVNAFLNSCPHRGARLCTEHQGLAKSFYCYYHGWTFNSDGTLRVLPDRDTSFAPNFNQDGRANMVAAPRLEDYRGLYFVNFDPEAISLFDYLGGSRAALDDAIDQGALGMEVIRGSQEYSTKANWKILAENGVDGNHAAALHASYFDYVRSVTPGAAGSSGASIVPGTAYDLGRGHALLEYEVPYPRVAGKWTPMLGEHTKDEVNEVLRQNSERLGSERAKRIANKARNLLIFPNLHLIDATGLTLRVSHPDTVDSTYVCSYGLGARGESETLRQFRVQNFMEFLGPGGFATPDDIEAMEQCQRSWRKNAGIAPWNDVSKGSLKTKDWTLDEEGSIRIFWLEWARRMGNPDLDPQRAWR